MVTYAIVGFFVLLCVGLLFGYSRLMRLQGELRRARAACEVSASAENDAAHARTRDDYNRAVASFPTNLVALITGFASAD